MSHPFWDKYLDFEERLEAHDRVFALLHRIIQIPLHQYARYFERFRKMTETRPLNELAASDTLAQYRAEMEMEAGQGNINEADLEKTIRARLDARFVEMFQKTQSETTKRWPFEQQVKRPYFHVTDLDDDQVSNWRKYLDFEEAEGNNERIIFLYERCVTAAASYEEFWLRYTRWMLSHTSKSEEVRFLYIRASCFFVPIAHHRIRLQWALFEEREGRAGMAQDIYEAMLLTLPTMTEAIVALAHFKRRQGHLDEAISIYNNHLSSATIDRSFKQALIVEYGKFIWKVKRNAEETREFFREHVQTCLDDKAFWETFLTLEMEACSSVNVDEYRSKFIRPLVDEIRTKTQLSADDAQEIIQQYQEFLLDKAMQDAAKEYLELECLLNRQT